MCSGTGLGAYRNRQQIRGHGRDSRNTNHSGGFDSLAIGTVTYLLKGFSTGNSVLDPFSNSLT
jgi:hypothetical protein